MNIKPYRQILMLITSATMFIRPATGSQDLSAYPFVRDICTNAALQEIDAVTLDSAIWENVAGSPPDIRIVGDHDLPIPHLLRKAGDREMRPVRELCASTVSTLTELPDNRIEFFMSLSAEAPDVHFIEFTTPLKDFERQISVWGIQPDSTETQLLENALIYDYSRFADIRQICVALPENHYRRFKIQIGNVTDQTQSPQRQISRTFENGDEVRVTDQAGVTARPFRMDAVRPMTLRQAEAYRIERETAIPVKSWRIIETPDKRQSIVEIDTFYEPITGFIIRSSSSNFTRPVTVEVPTDNGLRSDWRTIGSARISCISFRNRRHEELRINIPESRHRRLRLVITNDDNPPLNILGVEAAGPVWQALFIATPGLSAKLYYGAEASAPARYDVIPIEQLLKNDYIPVEVTLGSPVKNPYYRKASTTLTTLLGSRMLLPAAIAIMTCALAFALVRAVRRIEPPGDNDAN